MNRLAGLFANAKRWLDGIPEPVGNSLRLLDRNPEGSGSLDMLVLDTSTSMDESDYHPSRLKAAQEAACRFVRTREMQAPDSWTGIISFADIGLTVASP